MVQHGSANASSLPSLVETLSENVVRGANTGFGIDVNLSIHTAKHA